MSPVQKNLPQAHKILELFLFCTSHMSGIEQQHLRSAQSPRSLSLPQAVVEQCQLRSQLWVGVTVQVSSAITKFVPPLGTWGIFQPMQRSPIAQPPKTASANLKCSSWEVTSTVKIHKIL